jgi:IS5 family transposase
MEKQLTFTDTEYGERKRVSRREVFLQKMEQIIPWETLVGIIKPYYYKGERGRPPRGIEVMLRMYLLQIWFNLADESAEEHIYDSYAMRQFMKLDFYEQDAPDATTLLNFRHLLEENNVQQKIFDAINGLLEKNGKMMRGGSVIDATIFDAPTSTKNSTKSRDPEMHQTKKGNEWYFGMKAHIGADAGSGMVHSVEVSSANVSDIEMAHKLIREDDETVNADAGYVGIEKREEIKKDKHLSGIEYRVNTRKGAERKKEKEIYKEPMKHLDYIGQPNWDKQIEYMKSKVRSKVEHSFYMIKRLFGYRKVAYRGLAKNHARLYMLFCSANLLRWAWSRSGGGHLALA